MWLLCLCVLQVHYKKAMPDIEQLMDVWPEEFEEALAKVRLQPPHEPLALSIERSCHTGPHADA
jgi:hypothetical protein